jgi:beta-lactamase class A
MGLASSKAIIACYPGLVPTLGRTRTRPARLPTKRPAAPAPASQPGEVERSLYLNVLEIKERHDLERLAVSCYDSETRIQWSYDADAYFHGASTVKLAVLAGLYGEITRGRLKADDPVHVRNRFTGAVGGQPFTLDLASEPDPEIARRVGKTLTLRELAYGMITRSSNLATNLLIDVVGIDTIQQCLEDLKIEGILMRRGVQDHAAFEAGVNNLVTANGLLRLLRLISDGRVHSPEACADMLEILLDTRAKSGIPAGLPGDAHVAHKTGNISTVHHDAGIIYVGRKRPFFLVVLTQFEEQRRRSTAVAEVSRDIYDTLARLTR